MTENKIAWESGGTDRAELLNQAVEAANQLGTELFGRSGSDSADHSGSPVRFNRMISPASIGFALSMLREGASGETSGEMDRMMGLEQGRPLLFGDGQRILREQVTSADSSVRLEIANAIWNRIGHRPSEAYIAMLRRNYEADSREIDFEAENAADLINQWVSDSTHGRIDQLVDSGTLSGMSTYVANAVYFKGDWAEPFDAALTANRPFFVSEPGGERRVEALTMKRSGRYAYLDTDGFRAVRLPYGEKRAFDMLAVLPGPGRTLTEFYDEQLPRWNEWSRKLAPQQGTVELPKFKIETSLTLNDALMQLGMKTAFDPVRSDFGAMGQGAGQPIGSIAHKTFIEVDEVGTEAAAVTGIGRAGAAILSQEPFELKLNRPFFFAITERRTNLILFMGELVDPACT